MVGDDEVLREVTWIIAAAREAFDRGHTYVETKWTPPMEIAVCANWDEIMFDPNNSHQLAIFQHALEAEAKQNGWRVIDWGYFVPGDIKVAREVGSGRCACAPVKAKAKRKTPRRR